MFTLSTGSEVGFCIGFAFTTVNSLCVTLVSGANSTSAGTSVFTAAAGAGAAGGGGGDSNGSHPQAEREWRD